MCFGMSSAAVMNGAFTLSSLLTNSDTIANSAGLDEMARREPSYQELHSLLLCY